MSVLEIKRLLKKHFLYYNSNWDKLTLDQIEKKFKHEHGGYYRDVSKYEKTLKGKYRKKGKREYPKIKNVTVNCSKVKALHIPSIAWNDKPTQKRYIKRGNDLLLKYFSNTDTITIDLNYNWGGKATIMAAALSPIFNLSKRTRLTFCKLRNSKIKADLIRVKPGCYKTNANPTIQGTTKSLKKLKNINVLMGETFSAGEMIAIAFKSMADQFNITFIGSKTGGSTTSVKYFKLKHDDGISMPIGYMTDSNGIVYKKGVPI